MKVFFTASYKSRELYSKHYKKIYDSIAAYGYVHLNEDIVSVTTKQFYDSAEYGGRDAMVEFYNENIKKMQEADINIFEISVHSYGVGFLIQKSLEYNKPTIVFHLSDSPPYFLMGLKDEKLIIKSYTDKTIKKVVQDTLNAAREKRDKRFNFFISPKLLVYLENTSKGLGVTKSKFIRNLILEHMRQNVRD
ncbi:hypothetical protein HGB07_00530 [Candidatus Roizmanbacteria bacterium]|nr:hypothetical protein [Candidatus Roizmanbacteria bacterium]